MATTSQASNLIKKKTWLDSLFKTNPHLRKYTKNTCYWVAKSKVALPQRKRLEMAEHGIQVRGHVELCRSS